jgi:hypothetical protein
VINSVKRTGWFEPEMLLRGERVLRGGEALLAVGAAGRWWYGTLVLTSERLFFLPQVDNAAVPRAAFWLRDVRAEAAGHNRLRVSDGWSVATFELPSPFVSAPGIAGLRALPWVREINGTAAAVTIAAAGERDAV